jgi:hypothetical protein
VIFQLLGLFRKNRLKNFIMGHICSSKHTKFQFVILIMASPPSEFQTCAAAASTGDGSQPQRLSEAKKQHNRRRFVIVCVTMKIF